MGEERRIERLEFELAEAGTDILDLRKQLAEALADCAATSYKLSEAFDELVAYELRLAERDKLIKQVEGLLDRIDALEETLLDNKICVACLNPLDNCTCEAPL